LIPLLQTQYNPQIVTTLNRTANIVRREDDCLKSTACRILDVWQIQSLAKDGEVALEISEVLGLHEALQYRVIKTVLGRCVSSLSRVTSAHIQAVLDLCRGRNPDGFVLMPDKMIVKREYGKLILSFRGGSDLHSAGKRRVVDPFFYSLKIPDTVEVKEVGRVVKTAFADEDEKLNGGEDRNVAYFDLEKVQMPLAIRNRRDGDRFQPLGMAGTKKLKAWFIDEKIPRQKRDSIPLLADRDSVVWIAGWRLSERIRMNEKTRCIAKIEII